MYWWNNLSATLTSDRIWRSLQNNRGASKTCFSKLLWRKYITEYVYRIDGNLINILCYSGGLKKFHLLVELSPKHTLLLETHLKHTLLSETHLKHTLLSETHLKHTLPSETDIDYIFHYIEKVELHCFFTIKNITHISFHWPSCQCNL